MPRQGTRGPLGHGQRRRAGTETELLTAANGADRLEGYARMTPLGRPGQPDDIAGVVAFLTGPEASWVTGQVIRANGGMA